MVLTRRSILAQSSNVRGFLHWKRMVSICITVLFFVDFLRYDNSLLWHFLLLLFLIFLPSPFSLLASASNPISKKSVSKFNSVKVMLTVDPQVLIKSSMLLPLNSETLPKKSESFFNTSPSQPSLPNIHCNSICCGANDNLTSPTNTNFSENTTSVPDSDMTLPLPTPMQQSLERAIVRSQQTQRSTFDIPSVSGYIIISHSLMMNLVTHKEKYPIMKLVLLSYLAV